MTINSPAKGVWFLMTLLCQSLTKLIPLGLPEIFQPKHLLKLGLSGRTSGRGKLTYGKT